MYDEHEIASRDHTTAIEKLNSKRWWDYAHSSTPEPPPENGWAYVVLDALNSQGVPAHLGDAIGCVVNILEAQIRIATQNRDNPDPGTCDHKGAYQVPMLGAVVRPLWCDKCKHVLPPNNFKF